MTRAQAIAKLTKLFAMMSTMPSNLHEGVVAKKRYEALAAKYGLSVSDLLSASNPDRELVRSIVRERQRTVRRLRELSQFAVGEWKRQCEIGSRWLDEQMARRRSPDETIDFSSNPATFAAAKQAVAEAKAIGDQQFISLTALKLDEDSEKVILYLLNEIARDEERATLREEDFKDWDPQD